MDARTFAARRRTALALAGLTICLVAAAFMRRLSIDESQYVAATALAAKGLLPYRDYAYLQTPLQPLVFAPLQWLFAGHLLIAIRLTNALLGALILVLVQRTAQRMGAGTGAALLAAAMLASCESFTWCSGVARNDMLPAALMTAGLWLIAGDGKSVSRFAAGAALGLAASAKISYALPAAAVFVANVCTSNAPERRRAVWLAAGVVIGLLPTVLIAALAPRAFLTEAIVFPATAPTQYYTEIGKAWRLGPDRFARLIAVAAVGPALIAAIEVGRANWTLPRAWLGNRVRRTMLAASLGGLASAALNKPFQIFYLLPALPPLFVLAALILPKENAWPAARTGVWALSVAAGLVPVLAWFVHAASTGIAPGIDAQRRSHMLGTALRAQRIKGPIAALASQYVTDAGAELDRRFAAGPFLYRTREFVSQDQAREWHIVTQDRSAGLAELPAAAIVTGNYPDAEPRFETELGAQAKMLGYSATAEAGGFTIWTRRL